jgi:hypothetical protein
MARRLAAAALLVAALILVGAITLSVPAHSETGANPMMKRDYTGLWITADSEIRQALLPNGRYIEARGHLDVTYQGTYWIEGDHIEYRDDTGYVDSGDFVDGVLHNSGMVMYAHD